MPDASRHEAVAGGAGSHEARRRTGRPRGEAAGHREVADVGRHAADANAEGCSPIGGKASPASGQHGQQSPMGGQHTQLHRREATSGENPHIRRGIKGSLEFMRSVRVRPRGEERVDLVSNLECQRAQLRVLMRHRSPAAAGTGLVAAWSDTNLVV